MSERVMESRISRNTPATTRGQQNSRAHLENNLLYYPHPRQIHQPWYCPPRVPFVHGTAVGRLSVPHHGSRFIKRSRHRYRPCINKHALVRPWQRVLPGNRAFEYGRSRVVSSSKHSLNFSENVPPSFGNAVNIDQECSFTAERRIWQTRTVSSARCSKIANDFTREVPIHSCCCGGTCCSRNHYIPPRRKHRRVRFHADSSNEYSIRHEERVQRSAFQPVSLNHSNQGGYSISAGNLWARRHRQSQMSLHWSNRRSFRNKGRSARPQIVDGSDAKKLKVEKTIEKSVHSTEPRTPFHCDNGENVEIPVCISSESNVAGTPHALDYPIPSVESTPNHSLHDGTSFREEPLQLAVTSAVEHSENSCRETSNQAPSHCCISIPEETLTPSHCLNTCTVPNESSTLQPSSGLDVAVMPQSVVYPLPPPICIERMMPNYSPSHDDTSFAEETCLSETSSPDTHEQRYASDASSSESHSDAEQISGNTQGRESELSRSITVNNSEDTSSLVLRIDLDRNQRAINFRVNAPYRIDTEDGRYTSSSSINGSPVDQDNPSPRLERPTGIEVAWNSNIVIELGMSNARNQSRIDENTVNYEFHRNAENEKCGIREKCSICLCYFEENENVRRLPCLHLFHIVCIDRWLNRFTPPTYCPLCRQPLN